MFSKIIKFFQNSTFRLLASKPFGLDISDHSIEIISLSGPLEKPELLALERVILKPGIIRDSQIIQKEKLEEYIINSINNPRFGEIKTRNFIFSLPESKTFTHSFNIPAELNEKERAKEVETEALRTFPFPLEEIYYDFTVDEIGNVLLAAVPKKIVNDYLEVFKICQINPLIFETTSESLARALIKDNEGTVLIIDMGAKTTGFSLFDEKNLILSNSISTGGEKLTELISEKLGLSKAEAEKLKIETGLNPKKKGGRVFLVLQKEIQLIIRKIKEIEQYLKEKTGKEIEKIILTGGSILTFNIKEYLSDNLEKDVKVGDPWEKINIAEKKYFKKSLKFEPIFFSSAIGAALRGLTRDSRQAGINFLKGIK
jgi:type IV pilus assembly protein PilM